MEMKLKFSQEEIERMCIAKANVLKPCDGSFKVIPAVYSSDKGTVSLEFVEEEPTDERLPLIPVPRPPADWPTPTQLADAAAKTQGVQRTAAELPKVGTFEAPPVVDPFATEQETPF